MDPNPRVHPTPQFNTVVASQLAWGMNTAVRLAASHRDDLRCNHFNSSGSSRRQVKYSIIHKRPAIVHSNFDRFAIAWVTDDASVATGRAEDRGCGATRCSRTRMQVGQLPKVAEQWAKHLPSRRTFQCARHGSGINRIRPSPSLDVHKQSKCGERLICWRATLNERLRPESHRAAQGAAQFGARS